MRRAGSKYGAIKTVVDGITFASQKEARRYVELRLLEKVGKIWDLEIQPKFPLFVDSTTGYLAGALRTPEARKIGEYRGDFKYRKASDAPYVVEDVKGFKTPLYRWKKKHVEAQYGITILET